MWLSIHFPQLSLEALCFHQQKAAQKPLAIIENNQIICANQIAFHQGIQVNQSRSSAYAICHQLDILERNHTQEQLLLDHVALLIYQYSPHISIESTGTLLVEIAQSLKLYNGLKALLKNLKQHLDQEELTYQLAIGHTPKCAEILSRSQTGEATECWQNKRQKINTLQLEKKLASLSVNLIPFSQKTIKKIQSVGIKKISELKIIDNKEVKIRFGEIVSQYLLKLYGKQPDPKDYFTPKEYFFQKIDFTDVIIHRQGLLFSIKRLIDHLTRFLTLKQKCCQELYWELFDSEKNTIGFTVLLSNSQCNIKTYIELTQLNLERYTLHAPIEGISLTVNKLNNLNIQNQSLFDDNTTFKQQTDFIHKIQAKLGVQSCYQLQQKNEHIPELAYQKKQPFLNHKENKTNTLQRQQSLMRPSWLLEKPEPIAFNQQKLIWQGELKIISSQERITHHWWKKKVARDYFIAEHDSGTLYWVFFDLIRKRWFLHGIYS